jgi:hypothetical protein
MLPLFAARNDVMNIHVPSTPTAGYTAKAAIPQPHRPLDGLGERAAATHGAALGPEIAHPR